MDKSTAPFGEHGKKQSMRQKNFELATASPSVFLTHISLLPALSKLQNIRWCGDIYPRIGSLSLRWEKNPLETSIHALVISSISSSVKGHVFNL